MGGKEVEIYDFASEPNKTKCVLLSNVDINSCNHIEAGGL